MELFTEERTFLAVKSERVVERGEGIIIRWLSASPGRVLEVHSNMSTPDTDEWQDRTPFI